MMKNILNERRFEPRPPPSSLSAFDSSVNSVKLARDNSLRKCEKDLMVSVMPSCTFDQKEKEIRN